MAHTTDEPPHDRDSCYRIAYEFLLRDYRPTLILGLHGKFPTRYPVLFENDAYRNCKKLNSDEMRRVFAVMDGGSACIGDWIVRRTLIDGVAVITASSIENELLDNSGGNGGMVSVGGDGTWGKIEDCNDDDVPDDVSKTRSLPLGALPVAIGADLSIEDMETMTSAARERFLGFVDEGLVDPMAYDNHQSGVGYEANQLREPLEAVSKVINGIDTQLSNLRLLPPSDEKDLSLLYEAELLNTHHERETKPKTDRRVRKPITDWRYPSPGNDSPHFQHLRQVDWAKTEFGPVESWPPVLQSLALAIMENPVPMAIYWGPNYHTLYNHEYRRIARERDPSLLGAPFKVYWPELWAFFKPHLDTAYYESRNTHQLGQTELMLIRRGDDSAMEECYFDFSLLPIVQESGVAEGVLEIAIERTVAVVNTRRLETLGMLSSSLRTIQNFEEEFWDRLGEAFDNNPMDSPMLILYRTASSTDDTVQHLQHAIGVSPGGIFAPYMCSDLAPAGIFQDEMGKAKELNTVVIKHFPDTARENGELNSRGFKDLPTCAAVIPIQVEREFIHGFLVLGINPLRPLDRDYHVWLDSIRKELAAAATGIWMRQQEFARILERERHGAMTQLTVELTEQLAQRTESLRRSELLFTQTAETLPVGLILIDLDGMIFYSNHTAKNMFRLKSEKEMNDSWRDQIYREDKEKVSGNFACSVENKQNMDMEHRVGNLPDERGWEYWVATSMVVQIDEFTGEVSRFMVTMVDITSHKQNEQYQRQLSHQAVERRRQQENFIDIFSHELRNPFSAILQCADSILSSLTNFQTNGTEIEVEEVVDSAHTILFCVLHQMRIIDDVLTLSKLESLQLTVVPVNVRLHESVGQMLKVFHSEFQVKHIQAKFIIDDSYTTINNVDWVMADPARWSQILVNLLTNSIKFCNVEDGKREVIVRLAASKERPKGHGDVVYKAYEPSASDAAHEGSQCTSEDWGTGETLYIQAMVEDTGIGISKKWQAKLFRRFEQVPKTHVTYGGSGLGLFICRRLCWIQGGEIGFCSEEGKGSRFAFFIKVRRSDGPETETEPLSPEFNGMDEFEANAKSGAPTLISINEARNLTPAPPSSVSLPPPRKSTAYRVLIVEDNIINQEVLRRQLKNEGCVTHVANNGQQALDFVRESSFASRDGTGEKLDIILMDMEMPVMDGCQATRRIREMEKTGELIMHVPIMGISANARPEQVAMMTEAGMDDAIPKPFRITTLLERFGLLMKRLSITVPPLLPVKQVENEKQVVITNMNRTPSILQCSPVVVVDGLGVEASIDAQFSSPPPPSVSELQDRLSQMYSFGGASGSGHTQQKSGRVSFD